MDEKRIKKVMKEIVKDPKMTRQLQVLAKLSLIKKDLMEQGMTVVALYEKFERNWDEYDKKYGEIAGLLKDLRDEIDRLPTYFLEEM